MSISNLNADLARALGLPKNTTRAVLTLEVGKRPRLEVEYLVTDTFGRFAILDADDSMAARIAAANFVLRLEPSKVPKATNQ